MAFTLAIVIAVVPRLEGWMCSCQRIFHLQSCPVIGALRSYEDNCPGPPESRMLLTLTTRS